MKFLWQQFEISWELSRTHQRIQTFFQLNAVLRNVVDFYFSKLLYSLTYFTTFISMFVNSATTLISPYVQFHILWQFFFRKYIFSCMLLCYYIQADFRDSRRYNSLHLKWYMYDLSQVDFSRNDEKSCIQHKIQSFLLCDTRNLISKLNLPIWLLRVPFRWIFFVYFIYLFFNYIFILLCGYQQQNIL